MENKRVVIIGGGIAGMQAAVTLSEMGIASVIVEKEERLGGKLNRWDRLFPTMTPAREVLEPMRERVSASGAEVLTSRRPCCRSRTRAGASCSTTGRGSTPTR